MISELSNQIITWVTIIGGTLIIVAAVWLGAKSLFKRNSGDSGGGMKGIFVAMFMVLAAGILMFAVPRLVPSVSGEVAKQVSDVEGIDASDKRPGFDYKTK